MNPIYLTDCRVVNLTSETFEKLDFSHCPYVAIDGEWSQTDHEKTSQFQDKQFTFSNQQKKKVATIVLSDKNYPQATEYPDLGHPLTVIVCDVQNTILSDVCILPKKLDVIMFFSPKDVEGMIGRNPWRALLLDPKSPISKKRNLTGKFTQDGTEYTLVDIFGSFNKGLDEALSSVGIDNPYKRYVGIGKGYRTYIVDGVEKQYSKERMDIFKREQPNANLEYCVGDTVHSLDALLLRIDQVNEIIVGCFGEGTIARYTYEDFPRSSGSLVAHTFERWLISVFPELMRAVLTLSDSNNNRSWNELKKLREDLQKGVITLEDANNKLRTDQFQHGLGMGSIKNFPLICSPDSTALFGSVVQGGRCINEDRHDNPYENRIENVIDIDLSSCYGSALRNFSYPFGIPTLLGYRVDDKPATLKEVLKHYGKNLVDGLYTIVVKGRLTFQQDLVHSKYKLDTRTIIKRLMCDELEMETDCEVWGREIESAHIGGNFALTKKQIENGIITSEVLKTILKVSSDKELKEWMSLEVVSLTAYLRDDEVTVDEWTELMKTPKGRGTKTHIHGDKRTNKWCSIPMQGFTGKFVDYRKKVKDESKLLGKNTDEGSRLNLIQDAIKLFINTTYGCFAAPYFPMGNTVLANNITAQARVGSWMMSKALGSVQSITDGGMLDYKKVFYHHNSNGNRKPGFHILADRQRMNKYRNLKRLPLTDKDVYEWMKHGTQEDKKELDNLCKAHIDKFLEVYGLSLPFDIECKHENTARVAVYFGSADYLMHDVIGDTTYQTDEDGKYYKLACRGAKQKDHPKQKWLWHLLDPSRYELPDVYYEFLELIGVNDFRKSPDETLMPGDNRLRPTHHHPLDSAGELYDTWEELEKAETRARKEKSRGKSERENFNMVRKLGLAREIEDGKLKP